MNSAAARASSLAPRCHSQWARRWAPHGVHARVAEDDFQRGRGRRIPLPGCSDVAPHGRQHGLVSHVGEQRCAQISFAEVGEHYDD